MVDIAAIGGALGSIKAAGEIANAMLKLHDTKALQEKTIELNRTILSAQHDAMTANGVQSELVARIGQLEKEIADLKDWKADLSRYQLTDLGGGVIALAIKETMRNGEVFHRICATCAANGKKAYLQPHVNNSYLTRYKCDGCGTELTVNKGTPPQRRPVI
jgi:predicted SprT family Zn-dependent metalloprotease